MFSPYKASLRGHIESVAVEQAKQEAEGHLSIHFLDDDGALAPVTIDPHWISVRHWISIFAGIVVLREPALAASGVAHDDDDLDVPPLG